jgi:hypothetical protein
MKPFPGTTDKCVAEGTGGLGMFSPCAYGFRVINISNVAVFPHIVRLRSPPCKATLTEPKLTQSP